MIHHRSKAIAGLIVSIGSVVWLASPAIALPTFNRDPAEGPPGTEVRVWGANCTLDGQAMEEAGVRLKTLPGTPGHFRDNSQRYPVAADGTWAGTFTIPLDFSEGEYEFGQWCRASDMMTNGDTRWPFRIVAATASTPSNSPSPSPSSSQSTNTKPAAVLPSPSPSASRSDSAESSESSTPTLEPTSTIVAIHSKSDTKERNPLIAGTVVVALGALGLLVARRRRQDA